MPADEPSNACKWPLIAVSKTPIFHAQWGLSHDLCECRVLAFLLPYWVTRAGSIGMTTVIGNFAAFVCGVVNEKLGNM